MMFLAVQPKSFSVSIYFSSSVLILLSTVNSIQRCQIFSGQTRQARLHNFLTQCLKVRYWNICNTWHLSNHFADLAPVLYEFVWQYFLSLRVGWTKNYSACIPLDQITTRYWNQGVSWSHRSVVSGWPIFRRENEHFFRNCKTLHQLQWKC